MANIEPNLMESVFENAYNGVYQEILDIQDNDENFLTVPSAFLLGYVSGVLNINSQDFPKILELIQRKIKLKSNNAEETEGIVMKILTNKLYFFFRILKKIRSNYQIQSLK